MRTRVCRERRNKNKWQWWIFDGDYTDQKGGFASEEEARAALAKALGPHDAFVDHAETERQFYRDALGGW